MNFSKWLSSLMLQSETEVRALLDDATALHFLIAWSIFEAKCFGGFVKIDKIEQFAAQVVSSSFDVSSLQSPLEHFLDRYKDAKLFANLMHSQKECARMKKIRARNSVEVEADDAIFFLTVVV